METEMEIVRRQKCRKVPVLYYLCRNRQLEHPHFIEVPLVSSDGLYLRDVIEKFDSLRGKGMASMYSWSCKRSYKNAFVWNDLGKDDLIVPAIENEYVLKGSELVELHNSGINMKPQSLKQLSESPPSSITQDDYSQEDDGCHSVTKYKIYKTTHGLSNASTQTDNASETLESLMKADNHHFKTSQKHVEQEQEKDDQDQDQVPTNTKIRALLQLISCGSSLDSRFMGMNPEDKQYFSGNLVETNLFKKDETRDLKRSLSYSANRINVFESGLTRTKCLPRSIMGSLGKYSRSSSRRFCEDSNSCIVSPCISSNGSNRVNGACLDKIPSKRMESFGDNKENVIKIEERLSSGARVIIHLEGNHVS